jgi:hypothetical protein
MRAFLTVLTLVATLAGCAPVYEPGYRLELPASPSAEMQACVAQCSAAREACLTPARAEFAACQDRAALEQNICRSNAQIDFELCQGANAPEGRTCIYRICEFRQCGRGAIDACEADHRRCFAGCGGTVVEEPRCVANCPS